MEDTSGGRRTLKKIFMFLLVTALAVTVVVCGVSFGEERLRSDLRCRYPTKSRWRSALTPRGAMSLRKVF